MVHLLHRLYGVDAPAPVYVARHSPTVLLSTSSFSCSFQFSQCDASVYSMTSAGLMPTEARGNYLPGPPYLRETKAYHSQPLESTRHAGNYFVPLSIQPILIFCCRCYVKLLDY